MRRLGEIEILSTRTRLRFDVVRDLGVLPVHLFDGLTERQAEALLAARESGLPDFPSRSQAREVARRLGISRSTFGEHLRKAPLRLSMNADPLLKLRNASEEGKPSQGLREPTGRTRGTGEDGWTRDGVPGRRGGAPVGPRGVVRFIGTAEGELRAARGHHRRTPTLIWIGSLGGAVHGEASEGPLAPLRRLTLPVALLVVGTVAATWYVMWTTAGFSIGLVMGSPGSASLEMLGVSSLLIVVMMVAMMLPSALPMLLAYRDITLLEAGKVARPPDGAATALFACAYFVAWGGFGILALLGLLALGAAEPLTGVMLLVPAGVLMAAGVYQFTRTKQACLTECRSPIGFVLGHWREGRLGALRMGLRHSVSCMGCCWLFMIALFVTGAMSLLWMGVLSLAIFAEKLAPRPLWVSRGIAVVLLAFGVLLLVQGIQAL